MVHEDIAACARKVRWNVLVQPVVEPSDRGCLGDTRASIERFGEVITDENITSFTTIANEVDIARLVFRLLVRKGKIDRQPQEG